VIQLGSASPAYRAAAMAAGTTVLRMPCGTIPEEKVSSICRSLSRGTAGFHPGVGARRVVAGDGHTSDQRWAKCRSRAELFRRRRTPAR